MDWHTFFKELKDSGRAAGLFVNLMAGGFVCAVIFVLGLDVWSDIGWLNLLIHATQLVLALSLFSLVGLPLYAWRGRPRHTLWPRSLGSYAPRRKRTRKR